MSNRSLAKGLDGNKIKVVLYEHPDKRKYRPNYLLTDL